MKKCNTCNILKPYEDFFRHKRMKDGYTNICKACRKIEFDENMKNPEFVEKERERGREKHQRLYKGISLDKETQRKSLQTWRHNFPEKATAHKACSKLPRPDNCELHHWSYNSIHHTDIIEMERNRHVFIHRFITYDQDYMMYRIAKTGELLDTKEKHVEFINSL